MFLTLLTQTECFQPFTDGLKMAPKDITFIFRVLEFQFKVSEALGESYIMYSMLTQKGYNTFAFTAVT